MRPAGGPVQPPKVEAEWRTVHDPAALDWLLRFLFEPRHGHDQARERTAKGGETHGRKAS